MASSSSFSSSSSSFSSSSSRNYSYDVFCSFHRPDVHKPFLNHINTQFENKAITMFYDQGIERGAEIAPSRIKAIRESRISIVILSKKYASSSRRLDELVEILKCRKTMEHIVMPIFYGVGPSDVRNQIGEFGNTFHEAFTTKTEEKTQNWRKALNEVGSIAGVDSLYWVSEADMIEKIVNDVVDKLNAKPSIDFDDSETKPFQMIEKIANDVMVGLEANLIEIQLKMRLQQQFLSIIVNESVIRIRRAIKGYLNDQRVLIILDDVNNLTQLEASADESLGFGCGSMSIVVTTEDHELLEQHGICNTYNLTSDKNATKKCKTIAKIKRKKEDIQILPIYAFKQTSPLYSFDNLAKSVIEACSKRPLDRKSKNEWEDEVTRQVLRRKTSKAIKDVGNSAGESSCSSYDDIKNQLPSRPSRTKDIFEWCLVFTYFILEIPSCVLDQISSTHRPSYALAAMLLSLLACLVGLINLLYKGITENVVWQWRPFPWFYYPPPKSNRPFGSFHEMVGLICGVCQSILTTINYSFIIRKVDAPIKVSVWPLIFALGVLFKLCVKEITENNLFLSRNKYTSSNMHNV